jgi:hypothetical protein
MASAEECYAELWDWLSRPPSGYGNHSCDACTVSDDCPVRPLIEDIASSSPNSCSFYWPPNAGREPGEWYWRQLKIIAEQTIEARYLAALRKEIEWQAQMMKSANKERMKRSDKPND